MTEEKWISLDDALAESQYSLFSAEGRTNLLNDYPELRDYPAIANLHSKPKDLLWVWHYACRSSEAARIHSDADRIRFAIRKVHPDAKPHDEDDMFRRYQNRDKDLEDAVLCMRAFRPEGRFVLLTACQHMIRTAKVLMDVNPADLKELDWSEKKAAVATMDGCLDLMKKAHQMSENNVGITITKKAIVRSRGEGLKHAHSATKVEA